jgi:hypothetical protein
VQSAIPQFQLVEYCKQLAMQRQQSSIGALTQLLNL